MYRPESAMRRPAALVRDMAKDVMAARYIAWRIFIRDLNARYRQSLLGFFWAFVPPIALAVGFAAAGTAKVISVGETPIAYPAYVILSMVLWQVFAESVTAPVQGLTEAKAMLAKINFPREAIVLAKLYDVAFGCAIKVLLVIAVFIWFRIPVQPWAALAPVGVFMLIALGGAIGMALAPAAALYQDFSKGLSILLASWLFLTPVVYPLPIGEGALATIVRMNPVTPLLVMTRDLATGNPASLVSQFIVVGVLSMAAFGAAWLAYRLAMPYVIERLSA